MRNSRIPNFDPDKAKRNYVYQSEPFDTDEYADRAMFANLSDTELDRWSEVLWDAAYKQGGSNMHTLSPLGHECYYLARILNDLYCERTGESISIGYIY